MEEVEGVGVEDEGVGVEDEGVLLLQEASPKRVSPVTASVKRVFSFLPSFPI